MDYSDQSLTEAKAGLDRLYRVKEKAEACRAAGAAPSPIPSGEEVAPLLSAPARFGEAMDDDFNTAAALGHLFDAIRALNRLAPADPATEREKAGMFLAGYELLDPLFAVLGLLRLSAREYFQQNVIVQPAGGLLTVGAGTPLVTVRPGEKEILAGIEARRAARVAKQYAEADHIRKDLETAGVLLEDSKAGTTWKYKE
ncbi:MAG TPA: DALR domain-containing protein [Terriglobales bacterium]|nr:DALR domain-containing protein [Terriglobales bacterium]